MVYWLWEVVVDSALIKKGVRKKCAGQPRIHHPEDDRWSAMDQRIMHAAAPSSPHKCREETGVEAMDSSDIVTVRPSWMFSCFRVRKLTSFWSTSIRRYGCCDQYGESRPRFRLLRLAYDVW